MIVLAVLFLSMLTFRGIGAAGVSAFATWTGSARYALAAFPAPMTIIYIIGILELLGAVGLVISQTRSAAGI